jgi:hypothetical protein
MDPSVGRKPLKSRIFYGKVFTLSSMETFIIIMALLAAAGGTLVLLGSLANRRAQLVKAFHYRQELEAYKHHSERENSQTQTEDIPEAEPAILSAGEA